MPYWPGARDPGGAMVASSQSASMRRHASRTCCLSTPAQNHHCVPALRRRHEALPAERSGRVPTVASRRRPLGVPEPKAPSHPDAIERWWGRSMRHPSTCQSAICVRGVLGWRRLVGPLWSSWASWLRLLLRYWAGSHSAKSIWAGNHSRHPTGQDRKHQNPRAEPTTPDRPTSGGAQSLARAGNADKAAWL